ncbi:neuronal acetylcholine receptor subunit alpha-4-like [Mercenaria mercenaria]|uniref:neuronal acetylcholine receptor subunit alpha-4-like n=1 Tax=Mercenaria mercenaria TaxID=6596 RepID=UPI00234F3479|nr:neuronal acetylcholine receptor subunit alpha-4-like [Mercenaria mercenaria]
MDVSGFVTLEWVGEVYTTTVDAVDLIKPNLLWKPPVVLLNSVKTYKLIGHDTSVKIRYNFLTKQCQWMPWVVARAACSPDVKYYPFDKQSCAFRLSVWGYTNTEISLISNTNAWCFLYFEENGEWEISETSVETSVIDEFSVIDFKMKLTRRPLYHVINLIAPVLLLGALSACTFLLPAESGERIGFSVTCFLSYVVLLIMIMGFLPSSGLSLSYLSYYTFAMMIFSAAMSLMAIVTLRIYHKSEEHPMPGITIRFYRCFTCKKDNSDEIVELDGTEITAETEEKQITWKNIAVVIDKILFVAFLGGQIIFSVAYLVPIFIN